MAASDSTTSTITFTADEIHVISAALEAAACGISSIYYLIDGADDDLAFRPIPRAIQALAREAFRTLDNCEALLNGECIAGMGSFRDGADMPEFLRQHARKGTKGEAS